MKKKTTRTRWSDANLNPDKLSRGSRPSTALSRRALLRGVALLPGVAGIVGATKIQAKDMGASGGQQRSAEAFQVRLRCAQAERQLPIPAHPMNGDENLYPNRIGNYSKGFPHNQLGEVDSSGYDALLKALSTGEQADFETIPMGCPDPAMQSKLVNPMAGIAFDLEGADSHHLAIPPAPAFSSAEAAGEMVELYWQAALRDVPFSEYATHPLAQMAAADLSGLTDFRGPRAGGRITPDTLFRGFTVGDLSGPYVSQFLWQPIPFGVQSISQRMRTVMPGFNYLTSYLDWLNAQNGCVPTQPIQADRVLRYVRNGRDLDRWVHIDVLFQAYFNAMLILLVGPDPTDEVTGGGMGAPLNPGNPYLHSRTQTGFGTFGGPAISAAVAEVATRALKAVWYQKWFVHRRLRPEAFGGRVHNLLTNPGLNYPVHRDVLNSAGLSEVFGRYGTYLLPQGYPEGCPLHPAYGAGHATVAGASVTMLKSLFDESFVIPNPVVATSDGLSLVPYSGPDLTVGGELNKLAANVAMGRNFAGIHWRSDYAESLRLGEAVTISILRDQRLTYKEDYGGSTFTKFDGTRVTV
jgi:hypothetical protein